MLALKKQQRYLYPQITEISVFCWPTSSVLQSSEAGSPQLLEARLTSSITFLTIGFYTTELKGGFCSLRIRQTWAGAGVWSEMASESRFGMNGLCIITTAAHRDFTAHCPVCTSLMDSGVWSCRKRTASHTRDRSFHLCIPLSHVFSTSDFFPLQGWWCCLEDLLHFQIARAFQMSILPGCPLVWSLSLSVKHSMCKHF